MNGCVTGHRAGHGAFELNLGIFEAYMTQDGRGLKNSPSYIRLTLYELRVLW